MQLTHITIKNFRCFNEVQINFDRPIVLIQGNNGSGKTTLLEAIHYVCYLRSFRTHIPAELIQSGQSHFFVKVGIQTTEHHELQVGCAGRKRMVKIDQKAVASYKELLQLCRIIILTEDDIDLIKEGPETRRSFLDQSLILYKPEYLTHLKKLRHIIDTRNALFKKPLFDHDSYEIWTEKLWQLSVEIAQERIMILEQLNQEIRELVKCYFHDSFTMNMHYQPRELYTDSYQLFKKNVELFLEEKKFCRSLFGAHLDDFMISKDERKSKIFASRGQQKLLVLLVKVAQIKWLSPHSSPIFLLDDFMTDFDAQRLKIALTMLSDLKCQLIFTAPLHEGPLHQYLMQNGAQIIGL